MYYDMTELLKPKKINNYCLEYFSITDIDESICHGIPFNKKFIRLIDENEKFNRCIMSNTPMEEYTNREFVEKAHGDILIAGLGIGMIILPLQDKEAVKSITIIEKSKDIIDMITSQIKFHNNVSIINDDIFNYKPTNRKYDCIYIDIWNYVNSDVYNEEMKPLKNKYRKYLKLKKESPNRFISCWAEKQAKNDLRLW